MKLTFNEILNAMKSAFYNECGKSVAEFSETDMKFKAVASEIFAISSLGDYVLRQSFPQTAVGECLDRHGEIRDIRRKAASFATGEITFKLSEPNEKDVIIPKAAVCSAKGLPYIQFATNEAAVIPAGELSVTARATALRAGREFNCGAYEVTVMVNPPEYVFAAENEKPFTGGCDGEGDESLRERIISSYSAKSNGVNAESIREALLAMDGALDARVMPNDDGAMSVFIRTKDDIIPDSMKNEAMKILGFAAFCAAPIEFIPAMAKPFFVNIDAKIESGFSKAEIEKEIKSRVERLCKACKIGESISASAVSAALCGIEGVLRLGASIKPMDGAATCAGYEYFELEGAAVALYE